MQTRIGRPIRASIVAAALLAILVTVGLSGCQWLGQQASAPSPTAAAPTAKSEATEVTAVGGARGGQSPAPTAQTPTVKGAGSVKDVARKVKPAVVQITNQQLALDQSSRPVPQAAGVGSGVIYDPSGLVLTNNHVVEGAQALTVSLPDGRSYSGRLLGGDPQMDLAVVKIDAKAGETLPVARLGDSAKLEVGDWVVAIGNALALPGGPTVTAGVVGALGRAVQEPGEGNQPGPYLYDLIQTDAAINPGNSGGPLLNMAGEVVGINTLGAGGNGNVVAQGIGFAIAVDSARPIADQLATTGKASHPYLGISLVALNPTIVAQLGLSVKEGIIVTQVGPGSPADRAGLRARDVITSVDGQKTVDETDLGQYLTRRKPGDVVRLSVTRGSEQRTIEVALAERPAIR